MAFLDGNSCSYSRSSERPKKPVAYVDPKYLAAQQEKAAATEAWTGLGISLFLGLTGRVMQGIESGEFKSSSGVEVEGLTAEEIKGYIDETLKGIKCKNISEAETLLASKSQYEQAEQDLEKAKKYYSECDNKIIANNGTIKFATQNIEKWTQDIGTITGENNILYEKLILARQGMPNGNNENPEIAKLEANIKSNNLRIDSLKKAIASLEESKRNAEAENKRLEAEKSNTEIKIQGLEEMIANKPDFDNLSKAVNNLHKYEKQLKKLEAETTLASYQQEDSENITEILGKLKRAKANGNTKNVEKYEAELKAALKAYSEGENHTNVTLNNLARVYGFDIPQK